MSLQSLIDETRQYQADENHRNLILVNEAKDLARSLSDLEDLALEAEDHQAAAHLFYLWTQATNRWQRRIDNLVR